MAGSTNNTVTTQVADGATLDVLHWFRQNHINVENIIGTKVKAMTLIYDESAPSKYSISYTPADVVVPVVDPAAPPTEA